MSTGTPHSLDTSSRREACLEPQTPVDDHNTPLPESGTSSLVSLSLAENFNSTSNSLDQILHTTTRSNYRAPTVESADSWSTQRPSSRSSHISASLDPSGRSVPLQDGNDVPLPESTTSSSSSTLEGRYVPSNTSDSLNQLLCGVPASNNVRNSVGSAENNPSSNNQDEGQHERPRNGRRFTYVRRVRELSSHMPHLRCLFPEDGLTERFRSWTAGRVYCIDTFNNNRGPQHPNLLYDSEWARGIPSRRMSKLADVQDEMIFSRCIIVEDLSPELMEALGKIFHIDPELFAVHLSRSSYGGGPAEVEPLQEWVTHGMPSSYASLEWYRPVKVSGLVARLLKLGDLAANQSLDDKSLKFTWTDNKMGRRSRSVFQRQIEHSVEVTANIYRRCWPLSASQQEFANSDALDAAWLERASVFAYDKARVPITIMLVDPRPTMMDTQTLTETKISVDPVPRKTITKNEPVAVGVPAILPSKPRLPTYLPTNKLESRQDDLKELFLNKSAGNTSQTIQGWLNSPACHGDPIFALLRVVARDSVELLDGLDILLAEIRQDSMNDYLMTTRLTTWRQLLSYFETAVPKLGRDFQSFVDQVYPNPGNSPPTLPMIIEDLETRIAQFTEKMEKAYNALRSEMGILESRRGIAEAETVTKLTELAFIFIPLTFCSGLFSMQVNELQDGVPLHTFVVTVVIVFVLSYGARLILRSTIYTESLRVTKETLWEHENLKPGSKIPTRLLVLGTIREGLRRGAAVVSPLAFLVACLLTAVPVAFLWVNVHLDFGLNFMLSVILLPLGVALGWMCLMISSDTEDVPLAFRIAFWASGLLVEHRVSDRPDDDDFSG